MKNFFDVLPRNFFNVFSGTSRDIMSECILLIYHQMGGELSFSQLKEDVLINLSEYFDSHLIMEQNEESDVIQSTKTTSREKAIQVIRRLKECGWIQEELGKDTQYNLVFEDYAISIIKNLSTLDARENDEYTGYIMQIHNTLITFDLEYGADILERIHDDSQTLFSKLKILNANIRKYIQKIMTAELKDNLSGLLNSLLSDYQTKIIDRSYYNLTTRDHPAKYRNAILMRLSEIEKTDFYMEKLIRRMMDTKDYSYVVAEEKINRQLNEIIYIFETIPELLQEIETKNNKYISSAINRINFLLNNKTDIEGKINTIIQGLISGQLTEVMIEIYLNGYIDEKSLYKPRAISIVLPQEITTFSPLSEEKQLALAQEIYQKPQYTLRQVENYLQEQIKDKTSINASQLPLASITDFVYMLMIYIYASSKNINYRIIDDIDKQKIVKKGYEFFDFKIKKLEGENDEL